MGALGDRGSLHTTPGAFRQPTLFAIRNVSRPASATPIKPIATCIPQMTARTLSAWSPEADVSQIATWAIGSHESSTRATPIRIRIARRCWPGAVVILQPASPADASFRPAFSSFAEALSIWAIEVRIALVSVFATVSAPTCS